MHRGLREPQRWSGLIAAALVFSSSASGIAQEPQPSPPPDVHEHVAVTASLLTPTREASGTTWVPPATPMYGVHRPWHGWDLRVNGAAFVQALFEPRERHRTGGASTRQGGVANWGMFMARRRVGGGRFGIRTMVSAEPWTIPGCGSLSFLATGEVCDDDTIHDRQQPHDMFMELAVDYERPLHGRWRWQLYAGLAGEPALGPPAYSHRMSSLGNPIAPISHHWFDATQVSFGVVTLGVHDERWKAEMSAFNGREPDESRVDIDVGRFDSYSGRISVLPTDRVALQVSAARLRDVATDFPFRSPDPATRLTASLVYHVPLGANGAWATTIAYGANRAREIVAGGVLHATTHAGLLESSLTVAEKHTWFVRGEAAGMPAHHLHAHEYPTSVFAIGKGQVGYVRHFRSVSGVVPGIGGSISISVLPAELASRYFGRAAPGFDVFLSLRAAHHQM
jgi:hypothetical protein